MKTRNDYLMGFAVVLWVVSVYFLMATSARTYAQSTHSEWRVSTVSCDPSKVTTALNALTPQQAREAKIVAIPFGGSISNCEHVDIYWEMGR
mgnify:CR=1 FL=1